MGDFSPFTVSKKYDSVENSFYYETFSDLSLLRSGGSLGGSLVGPRVRERMSSALHQPREPVLRARLLETFEHPNLKRKLRDRGESAFAVRMDAEPRQSSGCRRVGQ